MTILEKIKNVLWVIFLSSIAFVGVIVLSLQNGEIKTHINSQNKMLDSLTHELHISTMQIDRILNSLEYLKQVNPEAYNQYKQYHDHETE